MFTYDKDHRMFWINPGAVHLNMSNEVYVAPARGLHARLPLALQRQYWFITVRACFRTRLTLSCRLQYYLIGLILGLAIYNSIILDVRFPLAIYKKLLGVPVSLDDLKLSHPVCDAQQRVRFFGYQLLCCLINSCFNRRSW
jgi:hypothetical protein